MKLYKVKRSDTRYDSPFDVWKNKNKEEKEMSVKLIKVCCKKDVAVETSLFDSKDQAHAKRFVSKARGDGRDFEKDLTVDQILNLIKRGPLQLDDGEREYNIVKIKDIPDMTSGFREQVTAEGLLNYYIGYITQPGRKDVLRRLPIFGRKDKYETRWFCSTPREALMKDIREYKLRKRMVQQ